MREQDLEPLARHRRGAPRLEEIEQGHAALRPNTRFKRFFFVPGTSIGTVSPARRRAASPYARPAMLDALFMVIGAPRFEARRMSALSGMIPSNGIERMSSTSATLSISARLQL